MVQAAPAQRRLSVREALEHAKQVDATGLSAFAYGEQGAGKTYTFLQFLIRQSGGIIMFDGGAGLWAYVRRTFPQLSEQPPIEFDSMEELVGYLEDLEGDPEFLAANPNILVDDITPMYREEVDRRKARRIERRENPDKEADWDAQVDWWERFNRVVMRLLRKHHCRICVTAQGKVMFVQDTNGRWVPADDLEANVQKEMFYIFDLGFLIRRSTAGGVRENEREAVFFKTRFPLDFPEGSVEGDFDYRKLEPLLKRARVEEVEPEDGDPVRRSADRDQREDREQRRQLTREQLKARADDIFERMKTVGSAAKGGPIPQQEARALADRLQSGTVSVADLNEIEEAIAEYERQKQGSPADLGW